MVALLVLLTFLVFITIDYLVQRSRETVAAEIETPAPTAYRTASYRTPAGVYFDPGHTWCYLEESGDAKVGISEFARSIVGDIDEIKTLPVGQTVRKGDVMASLTHGDRRATFRAPLDGTVSAVNADLVERRSLADEGALTDSWLYRIAPEDTARLPHTMHIGTAARRWLDREVERLRVFLSTIVPEHPVLGPTMQDGGVPSDGLIDHLGDLEWDKLHERFFGPVFTQGAAHQATRPGRQTT